MLKRQRPATPPPSSLDNFPSCFPDTPLRPLPHRNADPTLANEPRAKRRRIQPPVLDGALRGWLASNPSGPYREESDGEDSVEGVDDASEGHESGAPLSLSLSATDQYKHANTLLHELHTLHQHRLLFTESARDGYLNQHSAHGISPSTTYAQYPHLRVHPLGLGTGNSSSHSPSTDGKFLSPEFPDRPIPPFSSQFTITRPAEREYVTQPAHGQVDVHEVQSVRERYEDANRCDFFRHEVVSVGVLKHHSPDSWVRYFFHADVS
ncbi:hypothetical protein BU15DRAFT_71916 [Melanogaster broomeanus]|nr:hypothetical protein BU15DRAFT_71916 [Melanogaster broomeanus]